MKTVHTLKRPSENTPKFYETEEKTSSENLMVTAHYFMPATNIDYFVIEYDREADEIFCWGEVLSGMGELGYTSLRELEDLEKQIPVRINGQVIGYLPVRIEYDEYWKPTTLGNVLKQREAR